ncbi:MAG: tetratricopeptide repeat protein [Sandaracinaceae bacterium]
MDGQRPPPEEGETVLRPRSALPEEVQRELGPSEEPSVAVDPALDAFQAHFDRVTPPRPAKPVPLLYDDDGDDPPTVPKGRLPRSLPDPTPVLPFPEPGPPGVALRGPLLWALLATIPLTVLNSVVLALLVLWLLLAGPAQPDAEGAVEHAASRGAEASRAPLPGAAPAAPGDPAAPEGPAAAEGPALRGASAAAGGTGPVDAGIDLGPALAAGAPDASALGSPALEDAGADLEADADGDPTGPEVRSAGREGVEPPPERAPSDPMASSGSALPAPLEVARPPVLPPSAMPSASERQRRAAAHRRRAYRRLRHGDVEGAAAAYRSALGYIPRDAAAMRGLSRVALERGNVALALGWLDAADEAGGDEGANLTLRGDILLAHGAKAEALAAYEEAATHPPVPRPLRDRIRRLRAELTP